MTIAVNDAMPEGTLRYLGAEGPAEISTGELLGGKTVAVFGMPGAFTGTCSGTHMPGVIASEAAMRAKGVDEVVVLIVNDVFVADAWAKDTGADKTGVKVLVDGDGSFVKAMGMAFSAPPVGFVDRSKRFSMLVSDGVVKVMNTEEPGQCALSSGETLVDQI